MDQLKDDGQSETQCDSSIWIDVIDRGGLWRVNDTCSLFSMQWKKMSGGTLNIKV